MRIRERVAAPLFAVVIVLATTSLLLVAQTFRPAPPALTDGIALSLTIEGPDWTIRYESNETVNNTVFSFLLEAGRALQFPVAWTDWSPPYAAVFVDAINGTRNGDGGRWWVFWVDGAYGTLAADLTVLRGGEEVLWRFTASEGG